MERNKKEIQVRESGFNHDTQVVGHYSLGNALLCFLHWKGKKKHMQHETNYSSEERQGEIEKENLAFEKWKNKKKKKFFFFFPPYLVRKFWYFFICLVWFNLFFLLRNCPYRFSFFFLSISSSFKCTRLNFTVASCRGGIGCFAHSANVFCRVTWREETGTNRGGTEEEGQ